MYIIDPIKVKVFRLVKILGTTYCEILFKGLRIFYLEVGA